MKTLSGYYHSGKTGELLAAKPIQRRLLVPLAAVLLLLVGGFVAALLHAQQENLNQSSREKLMAVLYGLKESLAEQADSLEALEDVLLHETGLIDALKAQDRLRLLADCESIFKQLRAKYGITHFYFHRPDRVNLLRVHKPEKHGDLIGRFTAVEAERAGQVASGIELGPLGTFTLRVVRPVFDGDTLIGYLELGKEIEDILEDISALLGFLYVLLRRTDRGISLQQAELVDSKEHLGATLRSIGDGVIGIDNLGRVAQLNTVAETLTGWTAEYKAREQLRRSEAFQRALIESSPDPFRGSLADAG